MTNSEFPEIDKSYWKTNDKNWVAERKEKWEEIETYFRGPASKSKKGLVIIKRYYLKGDMPDFEALKNWNNDERHLDLFCFLWLHPSWDDEVLAKLRDSYVNSSLVTMEDVQQGIALLISYGALISNQETIENMDSILTTAGHNQLLFKIVMGNLDIDHFPEIQSNWKRDKYKDSIVNIFEMTQWLCNKQVTFLNEDCLYQYDDYLEYWYRCCPDDERFFTKSINVVFLPAVHKALYRIHHFDIEKEGDTCRTRFVHKMRKMLDEREFITEFKQMWLDVKAGKIEVKNPWKR